MPSLDVAVGGLDQAVGEEHQDVAGAQRALRGVELGAVVDAEQRALARPSPPSARCPR